MLSNSRALLLAALALSLVVVETGCGGGQSTSEETTSLVRPPRARYNNIDYSTAGRETADINLDGTPDQFRFLDAQGRVSWEERDIDWDGEIDLWVYYNELGQVVEQEFQLDFDDAIDVIRYYENGVLVRKELTSGFSDFVGIVKHYGADGNLLRVEHDLDQDGTLDLWEYYQDGEVVRTGRDTDGDGSPDVMTDAE